MEGELDITRVASTIEGSDLAHENTDLNSSVNIFNRSSPYSQ